MKRNKLLLPMSLLLVAVLSLSACSVSLPGSVAGVTGLLSGRSAAAADVAATATPIAIPTVQTVPLASGAVGSADLQTTLQKVYADANQSVVNIRVTQEVTASSQDFFGFPFGFQNSPNQRQSPQTPQYTQALGSGFVWDNQGHIVTNNHVIDGASKISVTFYDGLTVPATLVGSDSESDLAVIKVDASLPELKPLPVADSTQVLVGQFTVAIGNPYGLEGTMTFGIVSALGRTLPTTSATSDELSGASTTASYSIPDIIQTDAPVNPGNSGGALLDLNGSLIGVTSAIESSTNSNSGIGFAIPSSYVATGSYVHPWVGISGVTITPDMATAMDLPATQRGVLVVDVTQGGPADNAGLQGSTKQATIDGEDVPVGGDVIIAIDGQSVTRFENLTTYLARSAEVGQKVDLKVVRDGEETTLTLTLEARPGAKKAGAASSSETTNGSAWLGVTGVTMTSDIAEAMDLSSDQSGVLVQSVTNGSPADVAGIRGSYKAFTTQGERILIGGDVIVGANDQAITTVEELTQIVQSLKPGEDLTLSVIRDGREGSITVTLAVRPTASE